MKGKISLKDAEIKLKKKTILLSLWGCENEKTWAYQWYSILKGLFGEIILFDPRQKRLKLGSDKMKRKLLDLVGKKKPDYFLFLTESSSLGIETIRKINELSPKTKTIVQFGDDDVNFEERSRYYALFVDYCLVYQAHYQKLYEKDGLKNTFAFLGVNTKNFKPVKVKKEYDVSFIGQPLESRVELIRYLVENGIKVNIWGRGWEGYEEFKNLYNGPLNPEDFTKVVNQSKINLSFIKNQYGEPHYKSRVFEFGASRAFQLLDYFEGYERFFKNGKEIVMFKDKKELLEKVKYYLKHEVEREGVAKEAYEKTIKNYDFVVWFKEIFREILSLEENFERKDLPKLKKKIIGISNTKDFEKVKMNNKDYDYISFSKNGARFSKEKNYLQAYGLEKSGKDVSCCSYFVYSRGLGNYLKFNIFRAYERLKKKDFEGLLDINQIVVRKDYFEKNFDKIKSAFSKGKIDFVDKKNTAFVKIPLVQIRGVKGVGELSEEDMKNAFQMEFMFKLQSLEYQKRLFRDNYLYKLVLSSLFGKKFILRYLYNSKKENQAKLKVM